MSQLGALSGAFYGGVGCSCCARSILGEARMKLMEGQGPGGASLPIAEWSVLFLLCPEVWEEVITSLVPFYSIPELNYVRAIISSGETR